MLIVRKTLRDSYLLIVAGCLNAVFGTVLLHICNIFGWWTIRLQDFAYEYRLFYRNVVNWDVVKYFFLLDLTVITVISFISGTDKGIRIFFINAWSLLILLCLTAAIWYGCGFQIIDLRISKFMELMPK